MNISEVIEKRSEADIAAEFSHRMKSDGRLNISMEVRLPSSRHRSGSFRVDAIVSHKSGEIVCAVEFKRPGKSVGNSTRQRLAYADLPYPHFYIVGMRGLKRVLPLIFAAAGFSDLRQPVDCFGRSAVSRTGRVKKSAVLV